MISDAIATIIVLDCNSFHVGQETLVVSSLYDSLMYVLILFITLFFFCTGGETRTPSQRFWRPLLYQLSYTRIISFRFQVQSINQRPPLILETRNLKLFNNLRYLSGSNSSATFTDSKTQTFLHCYWCD